MSVLWKKIKFYKGKSSDCNCEWGLGQNPGGVSGGIAPFNVYKAIKCLRMSLKNYIHGLRSYTSS